MSLKKLGSKNINYVIDSLLLLFGGIWLITFLGVIPISAISLLYSIYLIKRLFDALGQKLPFKQLILSLLGVQLLVTPFLEYYYFQNKIFGVMLVEETTYFSYVFPAILAIHIGLYVFYPVNTYEKELLDVLKRRKSTNEKLGFGLVLTGYLFYLLSGYIPAVLGFVATALSFMRFIGFFYLWGSESKYSTWGFIVVFIPFFITTIRATIFIDLLVLLLFLTSVYIMKNQLSKLKILIIACIGLFSIFILQSVKYSYRQTVWSADFQGSSINLLSGLLVQQIINIQSLDLKSIGASVNVRLNQGWIVSGILDNMPKRQPFANGSYLKREAIGLLLPRFLYPDKPTVGDKRKFSNFVGWKLGKGTSMNVSIVGDGYGNFGPQGGILFCFVYGLSLGYFFRIFYKLAKSYPTLPFWGILIFFYSMRAGNEFYIIGNWIVKTSVLVFFYFFLLESNNKIDKYLPLRPRYSKIG